MLLQSTGSVDSLSKREKALSHENAQKRGAYPKSGTRWVGRFAIELADEDQTKHIMEDTLALPQGKCNSGYV